MREMPIDFVIAWVDGTDPAWQAERAAYQKREKHCASSDGMARYRDWELLKFWFRGVEQFAPWVNHIYFVTWGHLPQWLNTDHPKLTVVKHSDYIPAEFLPTFNSNVIELNFHRILGLSEQFVYFNDDMFLLRPVAPEDFFIKGKPKDMLALQPVVANRDDSVMPYIYLNNAMMLAGYFDKRDNMKRQPGAYFHPGYPPLYFLYNLMEMVFPRFTGFYTVHGPSALIKSTYEELWEKEGDYLTEVSRHRFRDKRDVNQYLLREWQKLSGNFVPCNAHSSCRYFNLGENNAELTKTIRGQKSRSVCINDSEKITETETVKKMLAEAFLSILPKPCSFEKS